MSPNTGINFLSSVGAPRVSGDEPRRIRMEEATFECSPRERG